MNATRQKTENHLRREALKSVMNSLKKIALSSLPDMETIYRLSYPTVDEETMARMELMRRHAKGYDLISQILDELANGVKESINFHCDEGRLFFQLATGKSDWRI